MILLSIRDCDNSDKSSVIHHEDSQALAYFTSPETPPERSATEQNTGHCWITRAAGRMKWPLLSFQSVSNGEKYCRHW